MSVKLTKNSSLLSKNDLRKEIEKLSEVSETAKDILKGTPLLFKCSLTGETEIGSENSFFYSFHPNGKTGCIDLPDDYMLGIRCNHLIWIDGYCECVCWENADIYTTEEDFETVSKKMTDADSILGNKCVLLVGNHKGILVFNLLTSLDN